MNKVQERGKPFDADEKTVIENMPFFLESLALRFEAENCPNLPKLCRAMGGGIESMQARIELLEKENARLREEDAQARKDLFEAIDQIPSDALLKRQELLEKVVEVAWKHVKAPKRNARQTGLDLCEALVALKEQNESN